MYSEVLWVTFLCTVKGKVATANLNSKELHGKLHELRGNVDIVCFFFFLDEKIISHFITATCPGKYQCDIITLREMLLGLKWAEITNYNGLVNNHLLFRHKKWVLCRISCWKKHVECLVKKWGTTTFQDIWLSAWSSKAVFIGKLAHWPLESYKTISIRSSHMWVYEVRNKSDSRWGLDSRGRSWKGYSEPQRGSADTHRKWVGWSTL